MSQKYTYNWKDLEVHYVIQEEIFTNNTYTNYQPEIKYKIMKFHLNGDTVEMVTLFYLLNV